MVEQRKSLVEMIYYELSDKMVFDNDCQISEAFNTYQIKYIAPLWEIDKEKANEQYTDYLDAVYVPIKR